MEGHGFLLGDLWLRVVFVLCMYVFASACVCVCVGGGGLLLGKGERDESLLWI